MEFSIRTLCAIALAVLLAACAGSGEAPETQKTVEEILAARNLRIVGELDRVVSFDIHGWQYVNRRNVVLEDRVRTYYLVELNAPCPDLEFAQRIAFTSFGKILDSTDFIIVTDGADHVVRCMIRTFYELESIRK